MKKKQKKAAENMYHCVENSKTWKNTDQMLYNFFYGFFNISGPAEGPKNRGGGEITPCAPLLPLLLIYGMFKNIVK